MNVHSLDDVPFTKEEIVAHGAQIRSLGLTEPGGVVVLTIFKHGAGFDLHHRAVMSRHLPFNALAGSLSMTQYYGTGRGLL